MKMLPCLLALLGCGQPGFAAEPVAPKVADALEFAPPAGVHLAGWIGGQMDVCKRGRIMAQSVPDLVQPFAVRAEDKLWRCEFWGKWFTSAALAYRYQPDPALRTVLAGAANDLVATQTPDGTITTYQPAAELSNWDVWGRKYTLLGLLAWHDLAGDPATLVAARRHADRILEQVGPGKADIATLGWWNGMAAGSILEPMVLLYRKTGDARYLEFAQAIVASWEHPKGPDLVRKSRAGVPVFKMFAGPDPALKGYMAGGSSKAYEMMSCFEGLVELHRATGDAKYLEAAKMVFADIRATEITILGSGSSWERWCNGRARQCDASVPEWMETCVTVTWLKLAAQLLRVTGDPSYADEIEWSTYNALLAAQKDDGTWWCHYNPLDGQRVPAPEHCSMHMNCCVANGPRGLFLLPALAVMRGAAGPVVNFYEPGTMDIPLAAGARVRLEVKSDYPRTGEVRIAVQPQGVEKFTLSLRVPAWSQSTRITVNGEAVEKITPGSYARITRAWKAGDQIAIAFDFRSRMVADPGGSGCVAITRGPVVFALDQRLAPPATGEATVRAEADGTVATTLVQPAGDTRFQVVLEVPIQAAGTPGVLRLCDYASSGHTWTADSKLRVWLPQPLSLANPFASSPAKP